MKKIAQLVIVLSLSTLFTRGIYARQYQFSKKNMQKNISCFIKYINAENFANDDGDDIDLEKPFVIYHPFLVKTAYEVLLTKQQENNDEENSFWNEFNWYNHHHVEKLRKEIAKSLKNFFSNDDKPVKIKDVVEVKDYRMLAYLEIAGMDKDTPNDKFIDTLIPASETDTESNNIVAIALPSFIVGGFVAKYSSLDWSKKSKKSKTSSTTTEDEELSSDLEE